MMKIIKLTDLTDSRSEMLSQVEHIFFVSSSLQSFSSEERKRAFYKRWCQDYQNYYPEEFFLMVEEGRVLGYLSGCSDSTGALKKLEVPGFDVFGDLFARFPAHLHINFHPDARGGGFGSVLVGHYKDFLKERSCPGLHLVTSRDAKNVTFYERLGFSFHEERAFKESQLFFMGAKLD